MLRFREDSGYTKMYSCVCSDINKYRNIVPVREIVIIFKKSSTYCYNGGVINTAYKSVAT